MNLKVRIFHDFRFWRKSLGLLERRDNKKLSCNFSIYKNYLRTPSQFKTQLQSKNQYCHCLIISPKMSLLKNFSVFSIIYITLYFPTSTNAAHFDIQNNCPFTVWAAATPGGGRKLNRGASWGLDVAARTKGARIWARTGCSFDGAGRGRCQTGDCGGVLQCQAFGQPPNTLAEYALNQFDNLDFIDISLVEGFNVAMDFSPTSNGCTRGIKCMGNIDGECPSQLRAPGGCNNPCTVFKTDQYCCNSGSCQPTDFSRFFKDRCPDAYSYPKDDQTSTFTCPGGTNYRVVFCPDGLYDDGPDDFTCLVNILDQMYLVDC